MDDQQKGNQLNVAGRDHVDQLSSLYGMTPKVEVAVIQALAEGHTRRVRALVSPLHPADQADLIERLNTPQRKRLLVMMAPVLILIH